MPIETFLVSKGKGVMSKKEKKDDAGVNVKVILRCRPQNDREVGSYTVLETNPQNKEVTVKQTIPGKKVAGVSKSFTFDGVCNQFTTQEDIFRRYGAPLIDEVLQGFNCTLFAYGQTGTGKTHTMEGDMSLMSDQTPPKEAGIIPRSLHYIYDVLKKMNCEHTIRVSYLEIYNEELCDLFNDENKNLRIYEDNKKANGSLVSVERLEEIPISTLQDGLTLLNQAAKKRRTSETLMNVRSSRSHVIFTIIIHIKETSANGEDIIKIGKLNLVDLAGSENVQRSGSHFGERLKEASNINQSLLVLGRVINSLVDHNGYIPYRDSKLTRLLQDSLGGKTKTCIIATVSPSIQSLEETLSTLDYAHRAKNIKNQPELNQKLTKRVVFKEMNIEIEKLKMELIAAREKSGVYLPLSKYEEMETDSINKKEQIYSLEERIGTLLQEKEAVMELFNVREEELNKEREINNQVRQELANTKEFLMALEVRYKESTHALLIEKKIVEMQSDYSKEVVRRYNEKVGLLSDSVEDFHEMQKKKSRLETRESENLMQVERLMGEVGEFTDGMGRLLEEHVREQREGWGGLLGDLEGLAGVHGAFSRGFAEVNDEEKWGREMEEERRKRREREERWVRRLEGFLEEVEETAKRVEEKRAQSNVEWGEVQRGFVEMMRRHEAGMREEFVGLGRTTKELVETMEVAQGKTVENYLSILEQKERRGEERMRGMEGEVETVRASVGKYINSSREKMQELGRFVQEFVQVSLGEMGEMEREMEERLGEMKREIREIGEERRETQHQIKIQIQALHENNIKSIKNIETRVQQILPLWTQQVETNARDTELWRGKMNEQVEKMNQQLSHLRGSYREKLGVVEREIWSPWRESREESINNLTDKYDEKEKNTQDLIKNYCEQFKTAEERWGRSCEKNRQSIENHFDLWKGSSGRFLERLSAYSKTKISHTAVTGKTPMKTKWSREKLSGHFSPAKFFDDPVMLRTELQKCIEDHQILDESFNSPISTLPHLPSAECVQ